MIPDPNSPVLQAMQQLRSDLDALEDGLQNHTHSYLTGKGTGHNNVVATTGGATLPVPTPVVSVSAPKNNKKKK
jgi:hypothetical protein